VVSPGLGPGQPGDGDDVAGEPFSTGVSVEPKIAETAPDALVDVVVLMPPLFTAELREVAGHVHRSRPGRGCPEKIRTRLTRPT
jgi:hypothetical protein